MVARKRFGKHGHDTWELGRYKSGSCSECSRATALQWHYDNPGRIRDRNLMRLYGMSGSQYAEMLLAQGGLCRGCGKAPTRTLLCVDHDHDTGRIRGLLCHTCNRLLGLADDSADRLRGLADYLEAG